MKKDVKSYYPGKPKRVGKIELAYKKKIDSRTVEKACEFLRENITTPNYWTGAVVGISDGLDGATAAALCLKALGKKKVLGVIVILGEGGAHKKQENLAVESAQKLSIPYNIVNGSKIYEGLQAIVKKKGPFTDVNIATRVVQDILFNVADEKNYAVISTINKSELLTGRLMEYFYGHVAPLAGLFKSEIFDLARVLNVPEKIIARKPGGVDTWYDEDTFGVTYDVLDKVLYLLTEKNMSPEEISRKYNFDKMWVLKLKARTLQKTWRLMTKELIL